jgi:hypothetical protein
LLYCGIGAWQNPSTHFDEGALQQSALVEHAFPSCEQPPGSGGTPHTYCPCSLFTHCPLQQSTPLVHPAPISLHGSSA